MIVKRISGIPDTVKHCYPELYPRQIITLFEPILKNFLGNRGGYAATLAALLDQDGNGESGVVIGRKSRKPGVIRLGGIPLGGSGLSGNGYLQIVQAPG